MTKALRHSLATNPFGHTYPSLMDSITKFLRSWGFQQTPRLSSSQKFTFDRPFRWVFLIHVPLARAHVRINTIVPNTNHPGHQHGHPAWSPPVVNAGYTPRLNSPYPQHPPQMAYLQQYQHPLQYGQPQHPRPRY